MPIHTPSPYRFLAATAPPSAQKKTKPQSSLRHKFTAQPQTRTPYPAHVVQATGIVTGEETRLTPARRFVIGTPDRVARGERGNGEDIAHTHTHGVRSTQRIRPPGLAKERLEKVESIDESSPPSSFADPADRGERHRIDGAVGGAVQSAEHGYMRGGHAKAEEEEEEEEMLFETEALYKRRRISPQPPSSPSSLQHQQTPQSAHCPQPQHQSHHLQTPASKSHRFKLPAPKTPSIFDNASTSTSQVPSNPTSHRPHFILPHSSPSPTKSATPLPETFSPSRKTGKYMPNGLASTLQSWIIETADTGYTARHSTDSSVVWGRDKEDGVKMRVRVSSVIGGRSSGSNHEGREGVEAWPGSVVFVQGTSDAALYNTSRTASSAPWAHGEGLGREAEVKVMLAGQGGARGKGGIKVKVGNVVGVRAPICDVELGEDGEKWLVGVEWIICS